MKYDKLLTDDDRLAALSTIPDQDWVHITHWEEEAKTEEARKTFHNYIHSMAHRDEYACYNEL